MFLLGYSFFSKTEMVSFATEFPQFHSALPDILGSRLPRARSGLAASHGIHWPSFSSSRSTHPGSQVPLL